MPETQGLSRYDHLKAIFSRRVSQDYEMKDDARSEITLVPGYVLTYEFNVEILTEK
jgi:hypothetical protein